MARNVFIVGGGAAGIMCALKLAEKGANVTLAEKDGRIGRKLLATGNGKCNLSNLEMSASEYNSRFVADALERFTPQKVIEEFGALGLLCRADGEGRVYPYCESAAAFVNLLVARLGERGVKVLCDCSVEKLEKFGSVFKINTSTGDYFADTVVLATGSDATYGYNSHSLVENFSHDVTSIRYAIAPLRCRKLRGANGVRAKVFAELVIDGESVMGERGELLFKDGALSGVLAFRLSSALARYNNPDTCEIRIDFLPDMSEKELADFICLNCSAAAPLEGILHKALAFNVLSKIPMDRSLIMSRKKANDIARICKNYTLMVSGIAGKSNAQVACGGIALDGIDPKTMQSLYCKGLYIIGEVADVDGLCGGYNLHWAWASALACSEDIL